MIFFTHWNTQLVIVPSMVNNVFLNFVNLYCFVFTGILNTFVFTLLSYWWLFLATNIFWKVWFPVNARSAQVNGYTKYIHLTIVGLSLTLSIVPIGAAVATGGYVISSFPPFLNYCYPRNSATFFYSYVLPFCIILPTGSTFNLLTLWKVLSFRKHLLKQVKGYFPVVYT